MNFGYEYFCGANVVIELEGVPAFEAVGISYQVQETKRPIYGYSSRFFDAVARGQVLVQGTFIVNYVSQDYVFAVLTANDTGVSGYVPTNEYGQQLVNPARRDEYVDASVQEQIGIAEALKAQYWNKKLPTGTRTNPHDMFGGLTIKVTMGDRHLANNYDGMTGFILTDAYIIGRGTRIQISEDVIVEEYSFFARDVMTITQRTITQNVATPVTDPADIIDGPEFGPEEAVPLEYTTEIFGPVEPPTPISGEGILLRPGESQFPGPYFNTTNPWLGN